jgi:Protein of unknown function (DUF3040)
MNDEQVSAAIDEIERALQVEDPGLAQRVHALRRADVVNCVTVFALLAVGAVLLTVGLATVAWIPWSIGLISLVVAVAIDAHHQRALHLPRSGDPRRCR